MLFHDRVAVTNKRKLADGRMVVDARFARAGIYEYDGKEVGRADMATVRVYRPPEEVFDQASMASFGYKAVTDDHPPVMVTADNWREFSKGISDGQITRDGDYVRVPMMLADAGLVAKVDDGKHELSAGYDAELIFQVGTTPGGEHYDAVMRNIRGNHIAVVDRGRAGAECRIADNSFEGAETMNQVATQQFVFDGMPIMVTAQGQAAIEKLQGLLRDAGGALEKATADHTAAIAAKDTELGKKDAEIADLKGKVLDAAALDKLVSERADLLGKVAKVADGIETSGKTAPEIRRAAVAKALGDDRVKDKSDDYVTALFDAMANAPADANGGTGGDPLRDAIAASGGGTGGNGQTAPNVAAYDKMRADKSKAWERPVNEVDAAA